MAARSYVDVGAVQRIESGTPDAGRSYVDVGALQRQESSGGAQFARPDADVADGSWTPSVGSDLFATIDEIVADDVDYDRSGSAPVADTAIVTLSDVSTPGSGDVTLRVRGKTT